MTYSVTFQTIWQSSIWFSTFYSNLSTKYCEATPLKYSCVILASYISQKRKGSSKTLPLTFFNVQFQYALIYKTLAIPYHIKKMQSFCSRILAFKKPILNLTYFSDCSTHLCRSLERIWVLSLLINKYAVIKHKLV